MFNIFRQWSRPSSQQVLNGSLHNDSALMTSLKFKFKQTTIKIWNVSWSSQKINSMLIGGTKWILHYSGDVPWWVE
jgi:hypothetical protein